MRLPAVTLAIATIPACAGAGDPTETVHSCSPSYVDENDFGRISAQQSGPGGSIAWGVYPEKQYVRYVARISIDGRKRGGGMDQEYEPHGTVPAETVRARGKTGSVFRIDGETYDAHGRKYKFILRCRLA